MNLRILTVTIFKNIETDVVCQTAAQGLVQAIGGTFPNRLRLGLTSLALGTAKASSTQ